MEKKNNIPDIIAGSIITGTSSAIITFILKSMIELPLYQLIIFGLPLSILIALVSIKIWNISRPISTKSPPLTINPVTFTKETLSLLSDYHGFINVVSELSNSKFDPQVCMPLVQRRLDFMGVLGGKWINRPETLSEFENLLKRIAFKGGMARFLLLDPTSMAFKRIRSLKKGKINIDSINRWKFLCKEYDCLQVRFYDFMPCFRMVFIDEKVLAIARYPFDPDASLNGETGWNESHIELSSKGALYDGFERLFSVTWSSSRLVSKMRV